MPSLFRCMYVDVHGPFWKEVANKPDQRWPLLWKHAGMKNSAQLFRLSGTESEKLKIFIAEWGDRMRTRLCRFSRYMNGTESFKKWGVRFDACISLGSTPHVMNRPDAHTEVEWMIQENQRITTDRVVREMKINHASAHHEVLQDWKVSASCVLKQHPRSERRSWECMLNPFTAF